MFSRTGQFTSELNPILMIRDDLILKKKPVFKLQKGTMQQKEEPSDDNVGTSLTVLQKLALENNEQKDEITVAEMSRYTGRENHFLQFYRTDLKAKSSRVKSNPLLRDAPKLATAKSAEKKEGLKSDSKIDQLEKKIKIPIVPEPPKVEPHQKQRSILDYGKQVKVTTEVKQKISEARLKAETARKESHKSLIGPHPHVCKGSTPPKTYKQGLLFDKFTPRAPLISSRVSQEQSRESGMIENSQMTYSVRFFANSVGQFGKAPKPPNFTEIPSLTKNMAYEPNFTFVEPKRGGFPVFSKLTGRNGKDPKIDDKTKGKPMKHKLLEFEKSIPMMLERSRRTSHTSHHIPSLANSRSNFNIKSQSQVALKSRGLSMNRGLPRYADPNSKLPAWMQKGVFLRGMQNEKYFEGIDVPQMPAVAEKELKKHSAPKETAEEYLAKWYLMAQSLNPDAQVGD